MRTLRLLTISVAAAGSLGAQTIGRVTYTTALPTGSTKDYIGEFSWRGITFEPGKFVRDNVSVGLSLGWTVFNEVTDEAVDISEAVAAQGKQYRYLNAFQVMGQVLLHRNNPRGGSVYLGVNAGTYFI